MAHANEHQHMTRLHRHAVVAAQHAGQRFDQVAAELFSEFSRSQLQQWIRSGDLRLDGRIVAKPRHKLAGSETLSLEVTLQAHSEDRPEAIVLDLLYEDEHLLMVNKAAGMVVHPGAGNASGTLVNALLHRFPDLNKLPRAGIVHRLDKLTSGVLMIARSDTVRLRLIEMLQAREISRTYLALVWGQAPASGTIDAPLGRHPVDRKRMAVHAADSKSAKPAITHYQRRNSNAVVSLLQVALETGRTHQIRVHMQHMGLPLVGDPVYAPKRSPQRSKKVSSKLSDVMYQQLMDFSRQALHARRLQLQHPVTGVLLDVMAAMPSDLDNLLRSLDFAVLDGDMQVGEQE
jgi:23S rRNA pseudouridine1911/1915/1917 synthase